MTVPLRARWLLAMASLMLALALAFPLWRISLVAPQYPEGLGMQIWAHTVAGIGRTTCRISTGSITTSV